MFSSGVNQCKFASKSVRLCEFTVAKELSGNFIYTEGMVLLLGARY